MNSRELPFGVNLSVYDTGPGMRTVGAYVGWSGARCLSLSLECWSKMFLLTRVFPK